MAAHLAQRVDDGGDRAVAAHFTRAKDAVGARGAATVGRSVEEDDHRAARCGSDGGPLGHLHAEHGERGTKHLRPIVNSHRTCKIFAVVAELVARQVPQMSTAVAPVERLHGARVSVGAIAAQLSSRRPPCC